MAHFHFSYGEYGQCEQCGLKLDKDDALLEIVNFWNVKSNANRIPYYLYVCSSCFDSRKLWCKHIYPDHCEICHQLIEGGDCYPEKTVNQKNESISSFGLAPNEKCRIICYECYKLKNGK